MFFHPVLLHYLEPVRVLPIQAPAHTKNNHLAEQRSINELKGHRTIFVENILKDFQLRFELQ